MEVEDPETEAQIQKALKSFCCFLYVGKDRPFYKAKPWNDDDHYQQGERLRTLEILASNKKTELVPIDKIKLAMDSKLIRRPETVMFALAMCARQKKSEKLRAAAYYFLAEHCPEWKYFILFIKYASYLCRVEGSKDRDEDKDDNKKPIGWGHGWKNAVNKWYLTKTVSALCELVTKHKGDHGWTHKDILKLSHPETSGLEVEKQAIVCYVINGLEAAEKEYNSDVQAKKLLSYIRSIEDYKRCQDKDAVVQTIETVSYPLHTIDYVHPIALKHKTVWAALLKNMDIRTILKHLPKLNQWGLLTKIGPATPVIVRTLTRKSDITWNQILPIDILTVLNRYELAPMPNHPFRSTKHLEVTENESKNTKPQSSVKGKSATAVSTETKRKSKNVQTKKRFIETKDPDLRIRDALRTALAISQTVDITKSSNKRYLVSMRFPGRREKNRCTDAALALALPLFHRDDPSVPSSWSNSGDSSDQSFINTEEEDSTEQREREVPEDSTEQREREVPEDSTEQREREVPEDSTEQREREDHVPEDTLTIFGYTPTARVFQNKSVGMPIPITKDMSFDDALKLLQKPLYTMGPMLDLPFGPLEWAMMEKKSYDVLINVTNEPPTKTSLEVMKLYRMRMDLPDARFINVVIARVPFELKEEIWNDSLIIHGFDSHVPWIIEAYVRGLF